MNTFYVGSMVFQLNKEGKVKIAHVNEWFDNRNVITVEDLEFVCKCVQESMQDVTD